MQGAIVHHSDARRCHALADAAGEGGAALAVEVAFQAMADGLVQQHTRPARPKHHRHAAGGRVHCIQVDQRRTHRLFGESHGAAVIDQLTVPIAATAAGAALFAAPILLGNHLHVQAHQRAHVGGQGAVGGGYQHGIHGGGQAHDHLLHARVAGAGVGVHFAQQRNLLWVGQAFHRIDGRIQLAPAVQCQRLADTVATLGNRTGRLGGVKQLRQHNLIGVCETGLLAADRAHTHALLDGVATVLDDALFQ